MTVVGLTALSGLVERTGVTLMVLPALFIVVPGDTLSAPAGELLGWLVFCVGLVLAFNAEPGALVWLMPGVVGTYLLQRGSPGSPARSSAPSWRVRARCLRQPGERPPPFAPAAPSCCWAGSSS